MGDVILHIYDVTNSGSEKTNNTIMQINKFFKDGIGLGGIFHSAIQVYGDDEWSFGFCEQGSGVFSCPPGKNPMYTYREKIVLGQTNLSIVKFNQTLRELSREWHGFSYDLLSRNCNHFCNELCERLDIPKPPGTIVNHTWWRMLKSADVVDILGALLTASVFVGWVNRFANAGDAAVEIVGNTAYHLKQAKEEIVTASKVAYQFLAGIANNSQVGPDNASPRNSPRIQVSWFKNFLAAHDKPSTSSVLESPNQDVIRQQHEDEAATGLL